MAEKDIPQDQNQKNNSSHNLPNISASPPRFVMLEELARIANGATNLVLAHEVAMDANFRLEIENRKDEPSHAAAAELWAKLRLELAQETPVVDTALVLLAKVREGLLALLLPHHVKLKADIEEKFDMEFLRQEAEHNSLDFTALGKYTVGIMAKLCAPVRDSLMEKLKTETKEEELYAGILEALPVLRLDMANFALQQVRPHLLAQSAEYERMKFEELIKLGGQKGLPKTYEWLRKFVGPEDFVEIVTKAQVGALDWPGDEEAPETFLLDQERFRNLGCVLKQLSVVGALLLVAMSVAPQLQKDKNRLRDLLIVLIPPKECTTDEAVNRLIETAAEKVVHLAEENEASPPTDKAVVRSQLLAVSSATNPVRNLVRTRILEFLQRVAVSTASGASNTSLQIPPGLSSLQNELSHLASGFLSLATHNRAVFGSFYDDIIKNLKTTAQNMP